MSRGDRTRPAHERTAEERERDREERARRRAQEPLHSDAQTSPTSDAQEAPRSDAQVPPTSDMQASPPSDAQEPLSSDPQVPPPGDPQVPPTSDAQEPLSSTQELLTSDAHLPPTDTEIPIPPIPPIPAPGHDHQGAPLQHEVPHRQMAARRRARGVRRRGARAGALLALAGAVFVVWFLLSLLQPFAGSGSGSVLVEIPKGSSASRIGSILARDGVVSSGFFFDVRALLEGKRGSLHSGRFKLRRNMSYASAIDALSAPPPAAIVVRVVIPEGFNRMQMAVLAREDDLSGGYLAASERSPQLSPATYGAPPGTPDLEGFLFPATYEIDAGAPAARLVAEQLVAFEQRFGPVEARRARKLHETPYQLLTVASMVEREAQVPSDRPLIAAVIYNRLRDGMPLGIDSTIYYAVALEEHVPVYTQELTEAQLHIASPYNTRIHTGLPPTPISNPGWASIEAAAHPAHVPYLYYVAAPDGCGEQAFSSTYATFQADVNRYRAAVAKNGGRPPVCKRK